MVHCYVTHYMNDICWLFLNETTHQKNNEKNDPAMLNTWLY